MKKDNNTNDNSSKNTNIEDIIKHDGIMAKGYGMLFKQVMLDDDLTAQSKALYAVFCSYAASGTGSSFPKVNTIMKHLNINNINTYGRYFQPLKKQGFITTKRRYNNSNVYTIISKPIKYTNCEKDSKKELYSEIITHGLLSQGYGFMPKAVVEDTRLDTYDIAVYGYFSVFFSQGIAVFPKRTTILHHLKISDKRYQKSYEKLIKYNYLTVIQRHVNGRFGINEYTLNQNPDEEISQKNLSKCKKKVIRSDELLQLSIFRDEPQSVENTELLQDDNKITENIENIGTPQFSIFQDKPRSIENTELLQVSIKQDMPKQDVLKTYTNITSFKHYQSSEHYQSIYLSSLSVQTEPDCDGLIDSIKSDFGSINDLDNTKLNFILCELFSIYNSQDIKTLIINSLISIIIENRKSLLCEVAALISIENEKLSINQNFMNEFIEYFIQTSRKKKIKNFNNFLKVVFSEYVKNYNTLKLFDELIADIPSTNNNNLNILPAEEILTPDKNSLIDEESETIKKNIITNKAIPEIYLENDKHLKICLDYITQELDDHKNKTLIKDSLIYGLLNRGMLTSVNYLISLNDNVLITKRFFHDFFNSYKQKATKPRNPKGYFKTSFQNYIIDFEKNSEKEIAKTKETLLEIEKEVDFNEKIINSEKLEEEIICEIYKSKSFPYYFCTDYSETRKALDIVFRHSVSFSHSEERKDIFELVLDCLAEMITCGKTLKLCDMYVTYKHIIDKLNLFITIDDKYDKCNIFNITSNYEFALEIVKDVKIALDEKEVKNVNAYVKSCIWTSLSNAKVKNKAGINKAVQVLQEQFSNEVYADD